MIKSMTGFGKATGDIGGKLFSVEVKSLNSKFLELNLRLPSAYRDKELELRTEISREAERGKIDVSVTTEQVPGSKRNTFNKEIIRAYYEELKSLETEMNLNATDFLDVILRLPQVMDVEKTEADPEEWSAMHELILKAVKEFNNFRLAEGKALEKDIHQRINVIETLLINIEKFEQDRMPALRSKIAKNLAGLDDSIVIDKNRFEQELIYYLEKIDITEEKVRLRAHCIYFIETMGSPETNGKKLGFITQEIGREINTIGSKANDANIQRHVVEMKDELEKLKEQLANIL